MIYAKDGESWRFIVPSETERYADFKRMLIYWIKDNDISYPQNHPHLEKISQLISKLLEAYYIQSFTAKQFHELNFHAFNNDFDQHKSKLKLNVLKLWS